MTSTTIRHCKIGKLLILALCARTQKRDTSLIVSRATAHIKINPKGLAAHNSMPTRSYDLAEAPCWVDKKAKNARALAHMQPLLRQTQKILLTLLAETSGNTHALNSDGTCPTFRWMSKNSTQERPHRQRGVQVSPCFARKSLDKLQRYTLRSLQTQIEDTAAQQLLART